MPHWIETHFFTEVFARHPSKSKAAILLESWRPSSCINQYTKNTLTSIMYALSWIIHMQVRLDNS